MDSIKTRLFPLWSVEANSFGLYLGCKCHLISSVNQYIFLLSQDSVVFSKIVLIISFPSLVASGNRGAKYVCICSNLFW